MDLEMRWRFAVSSRQLSGKILCRGLPLRRAIPTVRTHIAGRASPSEFQSWPICSRTAYSWEGNHETTYFRRAGQFLIYPACSLIFLPMLFIRDNESSTPVPKRVSYRVPQGE